MRENQSQLLTKQLAHHDKPFYPGIIDKDSIIDLDFYYKFLEENNLLQVQIVSFETVSGEGYFFKHYINYTVKVITDHISFITKRRYREFNDLYLRIDKYHQFATKFPEKTHIKSKITNQLSISRMSELNNFISEILALPKSEFEMLIIEFLEFLNIKTEYKIHNILSKICDHFVSPPEPSLKAQQSQLSASYCLSHQMLKLNIKKQQSLKYLLQIEQIVLTINKKSRLKFEDLREVLIGNNNTGLIELALSTKNQLVAVSFLKTLHKFFSIQECSYSEACKKILESTPTRLLKLHNLDENSEQLFESQQFLFQYFKLVDLYFQLRSNSNSKLPIKTLAKEIMVSDRIMMKYTEWKQRNNQNQIIRKRAISQTIFLTKLTFKSKSQSLLIRNTELNPSFIQKTARKYFQFQNQDQLQNIVVEQSEYNTIHQQQNILFEVSKDKRIIRLHIKSKNSAQQVYQQYKDWKYNKFVLGCYKIRNTTNIWSLQIKMPNRQPKIFKLKQIINITDQIIKKQIKLQSDIKNKEGKTNPKQSTETIGTTISSDTDAKKTNKNYSMTFQPIDDFGSRGFLYSIKITQNNENETIIDIQYDFVKEQIRKYFRSELEGDTDILWQGIKNMNKKQFIQTKQRQFGHLRPISQKQSFQIDEFI